MQLHGRADRRHARAGRVRRLRARLRRRGGRARRDLRLVRARAPAHARARAPPCASSTTRCSTSRCSSSPWRSTRWSEMTEILDTDAEREAAARAGAQEHALGLGAVRPLRRAVRAAPSPSPTSTSGCRRRDLDHRAACARGRAAARGEGSLRHGRRSARRTARPSSPTTSRRSTAAAVQLLEDGGLDERRQDEPARVRLRRHVAEPPLRRRCRTRARPGRTSGGSSGGSAAALVTGEADGGARHRHRRLDPDPRRVLRHRRLQADVRARADRRRLPARPELRPRRADGARRRGLRRAAARARPRLRDRAARLARGRDDRRRLARPLRPARPRAAARRPRSSSRAASRSSSRRPRRSCPRSCARSATSTASSTPTHGELYGENIAGKIERCLAISDGEYAAAQQARASSTPSARAAALDGLRPAARRRRSGSSRRRPTSTRPRCAATLTIFTFPFNALGWPALALPCGAAEDGLPASVQIAGRQGADALVLAAGLTLERALKPSWPPADKAGMKLGRCRVCAAALLCAAAGRSASSAVNAEHRRRRRGCTPSCCRAERGRSRPITPTRRCRRSPGTPCAAPAALRASSSRRAERFDDVDERSSTTRRSPSRSRRVAAPAAVDDRQARTRSGRTCAGRRPTGKTSRRGAKPFGFNMRWPSEVPQQQPAPEGLDPLDAGRGRDGLPGAGTSNFPAGYSVAVLDAHERRRRARVLDVPPEPPRPSIHWRVRAIRLVDDTDALPNGLPR